MITDLKQASLNRQGILPQDAPTEELQLVEAIELEDSIDKALNILLLSAATVTPSERKKLKGLLKYYAKKVHPFRACVRDNMKRFGPGKTEAYCAVLKDIIRGTTKWRGKNNPNDKGSAGITGLSEEGSFLIDDELAGLLNRITITDRQIEMAEQILEPNWKGGGSE